MTKRFWEPDDPPDVLLDWVSDNVEAAIKHFWEVDKPAWWIAFEGDKLVFVVVGPERPGGSYSLNLDLLDELKDYIEPYRGGPTSASQMEDVHQRVVVMRKLAADITALADLAEQWLDKPAK